MCRSENGRGGGGWRYIQPFSCRDANGLKSHSGDGSVLAGVAAGGKWRTGSRGGWGADLARCWLFCVIFLIWYSRQDIALLDLDAMKTFERAQFIEHQNIRRVEAAKALESSMEKVGIRAPQNKCPSASRSSFRCLPTPPLCFVVTQCSFSVRRPELLFSFVVRARSLDQLKPPHALKFSMERLIQGIQKVFADVWRC